jgi:4-aminobutyrate aminotransferase
MKVCLLPLNPWSIHAYEFRCMIKQIPEMESGNFGETMATEGERIREIYSNYFTPALHLYWPIAVKRGEGIYVESTEGKRYMDFSSGLAVLNIGHRHPRVIEAVETQMGRYIHTGGVYYGGIVAEAAERIVSITPPGLDVLFFGNSGAEAVEGALKAARFVTGRQGIIAFLGGFHGRTLGALSVTSSSARYRKNYNPLLPSVFHSPYPTCFRCPFGSLPEKCELKCFSYLEKILRHQIDPAEVAACIIEPMLGEGGYCPAPSGFLQKLRSLCDEHGILLIFDEVQSGVGRTGNWFAAGHYGVIPDLITIAKGIASGLPLSAVVGRREIMERWPEGAHGTTFGGNPVSCAASLATIDVIEDYALLQSSRQMAQKAMRRLRIMAGNYPSIGDVRGIGPMIGIEFVKEGDAPDLEACEKVMEYCIENGLILINCGPDRNVIRLIPPLITEENELDRGISILEEGVSKL